MPSAHINANKNSYNRSSRDTLLEEIQNLRKKLDSMREELIKCSAAERSLRESEEKYRFLVENSMDIIWEIDLQFRWKFISGNVKNVVGYAPDEVIGRTIWDFLAPEYYDIVKNNMEKRLTYQEIPAYEVEVIAKDGVYVPFEVLSTLVMDKKGHIKGVQGISRNIEYRKKAEELLKKYRDELEESVRQRTTELDRSQKTLQAILETAPIGIVVADAQTERITLFTAGAVEIFGARFSGWAGGPKDGSFELLQPNGYPFPPEELPLMRSIHNGEMVSNVEQLVRRRDGSEVTVLVSSAPVQDAKGNITAAVASVFDITYLKETEAALRDAKEQTELYLDLMGHDINNMNHIALGYLEMAIDLINQGQCLCTDKKPYLVKSRDMIKSSSKLIDNVRKIQRIKEGSLKHEILDLGKIIGELKNEYSYIYGREVIIDFKHTGRYPVIANKLLKDVFANLIGNAIKHSEGPLTISIKLGDIVESGKKYYLVAVEDDGPGIPDQLKTELLLRKKIGGKGIGLYLVRTFIKQFKGKFRIEDRVPGNYTKGSRFVVMLPAADDR